MNKQLKALICRGLMSSGLGARLARAYCGPGVIFMFHEMRADPKASFHIGTAPETLDFALRRIAREGRDIVDLDEALARLKAPNPSPFAVVTFDDGYRDNLQLALPILERHGAPATIYVPTQMLDRSINAWWLGLRTLFLERDDVEIAPMAKRYRLVDFAARKAGFEEVMAWIWADFRRADCMAEVFAGAGLDLVDLVDRHALSEHELKHLAAHPLITIGGHTASHRALATLSHKVQYEELSSNKAFLEGLTDQEVAHLAYPYGRPAIQGTAEASVAREVGFRTAVTTDPGHLFSDHGADPFLLPRENGESDGWSRLRIEMGLCGLFHALKSRFGSPLVNISS